MRNYVPQPGWDESEEEELPRKRAKKDKDAPKRPRTAYILFSTEYRSGPCLWQLQQPAFQGLRMSPQPSQAFSMLLGAYEWLDTMIE